MNRLSDPVETQVITDQVTGVWQDTYGHIDIARGNTPDLGAALIALSEATTRSIDKIFSAHGENPIAALYMPAEPDIEELRIDLAEKHHDKIIGDIVLKRLAVWCSDQVDSLLIGRTITARHHMGKDFDCLRKDSFVAGGARTSKVEGLPYQRIAFGWGKMMLAGPKGSEIIIPVFDPQTKEPLTTFEVH